MSGKQIEFPPKQTHVRSFEIAMLVISIICVIDRADHRPRHRHRGRVPPDRLSGRGLHSRRERARRRGAAGR